MKNLEIAHLKAGAALTSLIRDVSANGPLQSDLSKVTDATIAIANLACVAVEDAIRAIPDLDDVPRRRRFRSRKIHHRARLNGSP